MVGLIAIELVLEDEVCGALDQILEKVVDKLSKTQVLLRRARSAAVATLEWSSASISSSLYSALQSTHCPTVIVGK